MINDGLKMRGDVVIELKKADGRIIRDEKHNIVTNAGLQHNIQRLLGASSAVVCALAIGTGSDAASATQTALTGTEKGRVAVSGIASASGSHGASQDTITYVANFGAGVGTGTLTEAGLFNSTAASSGTMTNRITFGTITKDANDELTVTWKLSVAAGS